MSDTLITIVAIFLAAILMFIFPLMSVSERNDDIAQAAVQTATSELASKISTKGKITAADYEEFLAKIGTTGNTYEVEVEVQKLDENLGKKSAVSASNLIGENSRYKVFTTDILDSIYTNTTTGAVLPSDMVKDYLLNKGDNVIITVKNTNSTMAQTLRAFFYRVTGKGNYQIAASATSLVVNSGN